VVIQQKLQPYIIALSADERHRLPKISDKTKPFVQKVLHGLKARATLF